MGRLDPCLDDRLLVREVGSLSMHNRPILLDYKYKKQIHINVNKMIGTKHQAAIQHTVHSV